MLSKIFLFTILLYSAPPWRKKRTTIWNRDNIICENTEVVLTIISIWTLMVRNACPLWTFLMILTVLGKIPSISMMKYYSCAFWETFDSSLTKYGSIEEKLNWYPYIQFFFPVLMYILTAVWMLEKTGSSRCCTCKHAIKKKNQLYLMILLRLHDVENDNQYEDFSTLIIQFCIIILFVNG